MKKTYLPAEWHKQSLIQLTWPHIDTDWAYMLEEVDACFLNIAYEILKRQPLLVVAPEPHRIGDRIYEHGCNVKNLTVSAVKTERYMGTRPRLYYHAERERRTALTGFLF